MQTFTDFEVFRNGQNEYITVFVKDPRNDQLVDVAANSTFNLINADTDANLITSTFPPAGNATVERQNKGVYQVRVNTATYPAEYLAAFRCVVPGEIVNNNCFFKSVTTKHFKYAAILRSQVDKARKSIVDYIANIDRPDSSPLELFYGYDDKHLIFYLERGVQILNITPPYTALTVDTFPFQQFGALLIDAATIAALEAQGIFAIDTDYDYSLGGNSMVIDHFSKLSSFVSAILTRFTELTIKFKQLYRTKGLVLYQFSPGGVRDMRFLTALPGGFWSRLLSGDLQSV